MRDILGFDNSSNPLNSSALTMNMSFTKLMKEVKVHTYGKGWLNKLWYLFKVVIQILTGTFLMKLGYKTTATDWSRYKTDMILNSDHRKFDDMFRVIISGSPNQRRRFEHFLEQQFKDRKLAYGMHITAAAVIPCMVFQYHNDHIHFADGSGGGYTLASQKLKNRLAALSKKQVHYL